MTLTSASGTTTTSSLDDAPLNAFHRKLTLFSSGGPFLDGYILAIIGIALVQATPGLNMDTLWVSLIGASALVGVFLGGIVFGPLTDRIGRKLMYMIDLGAIVVFSILQFFVTSDWQLLVLRLLIGVAVGADYPIATALVAEFAPREWRARLLGGLNAMWFVGATVASFVGFFLLSVDGGWRWMLLSSAAPAVLIMIARTSTPSHRGGSRARDAPTRRRPSSPRPSGPARSWTTCPSKAPAVPCATSCVAVTSSGWCSSRSSGPPPSSPCSPSTPSARRC